MSKITLNNVSSFQNDSTAVASYTANNATLTTAFDNTLSRDGSIPNQMLSNLDMNSFRLINLPTPSSATDPIRVKDLTSYTIVNTGSIIVPGVTVVGNLLSWNSTDGKNITSTVPGPYVTATLGQLPGDSTGSAVTAGNIGEYQAAQSGTVVLTTNTGTGLASLNLTAGDWDVTGFVEFSSTAVAATLVDLMACSLATSSGTIDTGTIERFNEYAGLHNQYFNTGAGGANLPVLICGPARFLLAAPTTVWISSYIQFSGGGSQAQCIGRIRARRLR